MDTEIGKAMATMASLYDAIEKAGGFTGSVLSTARLENTTALEFVTNLAANNITFIYNKGVSQ